MKITPRLPSFEQTFQTIDSHTMGEATRIIVDGFPPLLGATMMERKRYLAGNYDHYRTALMLEPRGHKDMFGALITERVRPEADLGVIFMDAGGYLNMCGHGSIGAATVAVETGIVPVTEPVTVVTLDTPSGLIRCEVKVEQGYAKEVTVYSVPSFLYKKGIFVEIGGYGSVETDIAFGGSFFALVNADGLGIDIIPENLELFIDLGMKLRHRINETVPVRHPDLDITTVDLVEFYGRPSNKKADQKNVVVFGDGQVDRCPCGTGTSAKIAQLYASGALSLEREIVNESITGTLFRGAAVREAQVGAFHGVVPRITGSAYLTGFNQWVLDGKDPLAHGFLVGQMKLGAR